MVRFSFNIKGTFETDETSLALLQLSHLAEIAKANIADKVKLEFTDIHVQKDMFADGLTKALKNNPIFEKASDIADMPEMPIQMGLVGTNVMQDDLDKES